MANIWKPLVRRLGSYPLPEPVWQFVVDHYCRINRLLWPFNRKLNPFHSGASMKPTFPDCHYLSYSQIFRETPTHLKVGDVVSAIPWPAVRESENAGGSEFLVCKRIVAMAGDVAHLGKRKVPRVVCQYLSRQVHTQ